MAKFGVLITTYYRKNGLTRFFLRRSLKCLLNQSNKDWKLYLIGDCYQPEKELFDCAKVIPENKICLINMPNSPERENLSPGELWGVAGMTAQNYGLDIIRNECEIFCRLDDDDFWESNHLESFNEFYTNNTAFAYTRAKHVSGYLPQEHHIIDVQPNNVPPRAYNLVHSASSWRPDLIPFNYRSPNGTGFVAADAVMWEDIRNYCQSKNYEMIYIPRMTVIHDSEGIFKEKIIFC